MQEDLPISFGGAHVGADGEIMDSWQELFLNSESRVKQKFDLSSPTWWKLRSASMPNCACTVFFDGRVANGYAHFASGVALSFCT